MSDVGSVVEWAGVAEGGADHNIVRFFWKEKQNKKQSEIDGRPRFDMVPYLEIFAPGQIRNTRIERKATDEDKEKYQSQWAKFSAHAEAQAGTSIEEWPYLNRAQVAELKAVGFPTVEAIAGAGDSGLAKMGMGGRDLQKRAQQFLKPQDDVLTELRAQIRAQEDRIRDQESKIEHLTQALEAKPRGRPRKIRDEDDASNGLSDGA